jgi:hypothetical protein
MLDPKAHCAAVAAGGRSARPGDALWEQRLARWTSTQGAISMPAPRKPPTGAQPPPPQPPPAEAPTPQELAQPTRATQESVPLAGAYGARPPFPDFDDDGIDAEKIRNCVDAYSEGTLERLGVNRAASALVKQYLTGPMDIGAGDLENKLCEFAKRDSSRLSAEVRKDVTVRPPRDETLERLMLDLSESIIQWDLSKGSRVAVTPLPEEAAYQAVVEDIGTLQRFLNDEGSGGVGFVAHEAGEQRGEAFAILNHPALSAHVPGTTVFDRVTALLPDEDDLPTPKEARHAARTAAIARKLGYEIADFDDLEGDLNEISRLAYKFRAAHRSTNSDVVAAAKPGREKEAQVDEVERAVLVFRG